MATKYGPFTEDHISNFRELVRQAEHIGWSGAFDSPQEHRETAQWLATVDEAREGRWQQQELDVAKERAKVTQALLDWDGRTQKEADRADAAEARLAEVEMASKQMDFAYDCLKKKLAEVEKERDVLARDLPGTMDGARAYLIGVEKERDAEKARADKAEAERDALLAAQRGAIKDTERLEADVATLREALTNLARTGPLNRGHMQAKAFEVLAATDPKGGE